MILNNNLRSVFFMCLNYLNYLHIFIEFYVYSIKLFITFEYEFIFVSWIFLNPCELNIAAAIYNHKIIIEKFCIQEGLFSSLQNTQLFYAILILSVIVLISRMFAIKLLYFFHLIFNSINFLHLNMLNLS